MEDKTESFQIDLVADNDIEEVLEIYKPIVEETHTSFEYEVPGLSEFTERIHSYTKYWPWLVCRYEGRVVGFAYAIQLRGRISYTWSVELSVYVKPDFQGKGIGRKLYIALMNLLRVQGARNFYAVIALPNEPSEAFHKSLGFEKFTVFEKVGFKNRWIDIVGYIIRDGGDEPPQEWISMNELCEMKECKKILEEASS